MTNYNDGKWHGWNGGECPVHVETEVEVSFNNASKQGTYAGKASKWYWENGRGPSDIIAFRVTKEHKEPREFWIVGTHWTEDREFAETKRASGYTVIHVREVIGDDT